MRAWKFAAGLVLLLVVCNNVQVLDALPEVNFAPGLPRKILPDFRQYTKEELKIKSTFEKCALKWLATAGLNCTGGTMPSEDFNKFVEKSKGDNAAEEFKKIHKQICHPDLNCMNGTCVCKDTSMTSKCNQASPAQDLSQNCDSQSKAFFVVAKRNTGNSLSDPCQNFQYIILMIIIFVLAAP